MTVEGQRIILVPMAPARLNAVRPNPERRRIPPAGVAAPSPSSLEPGIADLVRLQREAGNAAVVTLLQRQPNGPGEIPGEVAGTPAAAVPDRKTLRYGHTGPDVKQLQMKLRLIRERQHDRDAGGNARIDGIFGPLTRKDVLDFQSDTGLGADGVVGPKTWHALDSLVPGTPTEAGEGAKNEEFGEGVRLKNARQYDAALAVFESYLASSATPEMANGALGNIAICHQQRGRFGLAVATWERALVGRFNQEDRRRSALDSLLKARRGEFLDSPAPDPEPLPPGADAATAAGREGGGVTERQPVKSGDSGPAVDLFKGKLGHMMIGWPPKLPAGDTFDAPTAERTRAFQQATGLEATGEGDASTWHALDSFTKADVPFSILRPLWDRNMEAVRVGETDPAAALPLLEANRDEARALGLVEDVRMTEMQIGRRHHQLSHFPEAVEHYTIYLDRNIPNPEQYGSFLEELRKARRGEPAA